MTYQPPPEDPRYGQQPDQPPMAPPPPPPPPAAPQYSAPAPPPPPPAYAPAARSAGPAFDPKSINPMDWALAGLALLGLIFTYTSYYTYYGYSQGGGFVGFLAWLCGVIAVAAVFVPMFVPALKLPFPPRLIALGGFAVATLLTLLKLLIRPSYGGCGFGLCAKLTLHIGFGLIACLVVFAAGTAISLLRLRATGGKLPWE